MRATALTTSPIFPACLSNSSSMRTHAAWRSAGRPTLAMLAEICVLTLLSATGNVSVLRMDARRCRWRSGWLPKCASSRAAIVRRRTPLLPSRWRSSPSPYEVRRRLRRLRQCHRRPAWWPRQRVQRLLLAREGPLPAPMTLPTRRGEFQGRCNGLAGLSGEMTVHATGGFRQFARFNQRQWRAPPFNVSRIGLGLND